MEDRIFYPYRLVDPATGRTRKILGLLVSPEEFMRITAEIDAEPAPVSPGMQAAIDDFNHWLSESQGP